MQGKGELRTGQEFLMWKYYFLIRGKQKTLCKKNKTFLKRSRISLKTKEKIFREGTLKIFEDRNIMFLDR